MRKGNTKIPFEPIEAFRYQRNQLVNPTVAKPSDRRLLAEEHTKKRNMAKKLPISAPRLIMGR